MTGIVNLCGMYQMIFVQYSKKPFLKLCKTGKTEGKEMKKIWKGQLFTGTKADFYGGKAAEWKKNRQIKVE